MMLETDRSIQYYIRDLQFESKQSSLTRDTIGVSRNPKANAPYLLRAFSLDYDFFIGLRELGESIFY